MIGTACWPMPWPGNDGEGGDADSGVGVNAAFVMQLRDMLARMDELGVSEDREGTALSA
mgnify:CR=1 FL=1